MPKKPQVVPISSLGEVILSCCSRILTLNFTKRALQEATLKFGKGLGMKVDARQPASLVLDSGDNQKLLLDIKTKNGLTIDVDVSPGGTARNSK
jgi:hypothetical protein